MKEGYHITDLYFSELNRSLIFWETCWDVDTDSETRGRGGVGWDSGSLTSPRWCSCCWSAGHIWFSGTFFNKIISGGFLILVYRTVFFSLGCFWPQGRLAVSEDIFDPHISVRTTDIMWLGARDATKHPVMHRVAPQRICWPQMSLVPKLRNPVVEILFCVSYQK